MQSNMLNLERERDEFETMCQDYQKQREADRLRPAGGPIIGLAGEFADQIDFVTSIGGLTSNLKKLNKFKKRMRESYYGLGKEQLTNFFGDYEQRRIPIAKPADFYKELEEKKKFTLLENEQAFKLK